MTDSIHAGSTFDSFLAEEGLLKEVEAIAVKRVLAWQFAEAIREQGTSKTALARSMKTSRSQLDRLLDPSNVAVSLETVPRAARALGMRMGLRIVAAEPVPDQLG